MRLGRFDARALPLKDILNATGTGFYIPLYQRPYRWTSDNAQRLVDDIVDGIVRFQDTGRSSTFLGSVITVDEYRSLVPTPTDRPGTVLQVIDGQQRIATLLGLCGELRRAIRAAFERLRYDEQNILRDVVQRQCYELEMALSFKISEPDHSTLPRMIRGGEDRWGRKTGEYESDIARYLVAYRSHEARHDVGYPVFDEVTRTMGQLFSSEEPFDSRLMPLDTDQWEALFFQSPPEDLQESVASDRLLMLLTFAAFTMSHVQVISVAAEDEDTAFAVFEPLNTTGEPLTAFETFLPLVVSSHGGQRNYADSDDRIQIDRFQSLLENQSAKDVVQRTKRALVAFALLDTGEGIGEGLRDQRFYLRRYPSLNRVEQDLFLNSLGNTADCLRHLWYGVDALASADDRTRIALRVLIDSRHTIPLGLLIAGYSQFGNDSPELHELVRTIADCWLLWRLSRSSTANIDGHYRNLMAGHDMDGSFLGPYCQRPKKAKRKLPDPDDVAEDFRTILENKGGVTDRESWIEKTLDVPHGLQSNKTLLRYALLGAYHDIVVDKSSDVLERGAYNSSPTLTSYWYEAQLTVEHIAPRSPLPADQSFSDLIYRDHRVHRIGNLTLVPQKENSALGNKSWSDKRDYFRVFAERRQQARDALIADLNLQSETVALLSQTFLPFCTDVANSQAVRWTEDNISTRGRALAELIWDRFAPSLGF